MSRGSRRASSGVGEMINWMSTAASIYLFKSYIITLVWVGNSYEFFVCFVLLFGWKWLHPFLTFCTYLHAYLYICLVIFLYIGM